jgi:general secretion pathway protein H
MVVMALVAIATALVSLALRDPTAAQLDQEAMRLAALLEAARTESRAAGVPVRFEIGSAEPGSSGDFRFVGLPATTPLPNHWLDPEVSAQIIGARALVLGPEPLIGAQRVVLRLGERSLTLGTDGLGPFTPLESEGPGQAAGAK